ncbi:MAG: hypothetical protein FWE98_02375 [Oscillospiraceae bacterium]|nr:hypothetical protein [Oscillospiraceae bacterium]
MHNTHWTKKLTVLLAALCLALVGVSAFTPARAQDWLLQVEGVPVSRAVYSFFLDQALPGAKRNADGSPKDTAALRKDVAARCVAYYAVNSELRARGVPLDQGLKAEVAARTAFYWQAFGLYYSSIGVDKQTLNAILAGEAARDQLFRALYDAGGTRAAGEEALREYFYANYAAYDGVRVFRTALQEDGTEREMTPGELAELKAALREFVEAANEADDFYGVAQEERFEGVLSYMPFVTVAQKGSAAAGGGGELSDADFAKVRALSREKLALVELEDFLLVAVGVDMSQAEEEYYLGCRADCLWALCGEAYAEDLKALNAQLRAVENVAAVERLYREWAW